MKFLNMVMMVLMALLSGRELLERGTKGVNTKDGLFAAVFAHSPVRRAVLVSKYSG